MHLQSRGGAEQQQKQALSIGEKEIWTLTVVMQTQRTTVIRFPLNLWEIKFNKPKKEK
jgi:hypothetical protein